MMVQGKDARFFCFGPALAMCSGLLHALCAGTVPEENMKRLFFGKAAFLRRKRSAAAMFGENMSESRLGTVGIVVDDLESTSLINAILHQYADIIVGRLGIPYRSRGVSIIGRKHGRHFRHDGTSGQAAGRIRQGRHFQAVSV